MTLYEQLRAPSPPSSTEPSRNDGKDRLWPTCCCTATMTQSRVLRLGPNVPCDLTLCLSRRREKAAQMTMQ
ncbi:MAG: hypothetical protein KBA91_01935 [Candidatus Moranbacteria bacterium]|nr:hypothetical protein [Candidatus Moranbacteria bacterium]